LDAIVMSVLVICAWMVVNALKMQEEQLSLLSMLCTRQA
jgi:hypothetical protein